MGRPASILPRITFRLSEELRQRLEEAAKQNGVSVNAEIVDRLTASFETPDRLIRESKGFEDRLEELRASHDEMRMNYTRLHDAMKLLFEESGQQLDLGDRN